MKKSFKYSNNGGFSLIELIIVIAIFIIISVLGIPFFLKLIDMARFESAKNHMRESFTSCINAPNVSPSNPNIPGVAFQSSNCSSLMSATIDNSCTFSMDMSTGAKTGWTDSYDQCVSASNNSSGGGSGEISVTGDSDSNSGSGNEGDIAVARTNNKGDQIFDGPSCSMANESKVQGNFGMETVSGGKHCACDSNKGESYSYKVNNFQGNENFTGGAVFLACYDMDGKFIENKPRWSIPSTDGGAGDNYDWLKYKKWLQDGGKPNEFHTNPKN